MKNPCARAFRLIRSANNLTQNEFSEQIDVTPSFVGQIERGKAFPSYEVMNRIVEKFNVDANLFFGGGNAHSVVDNSFYKLVADLSPDQLEAIKALLRFVTNISMLNSDALINKDEPGK